MNHFFSLGFIAILGAFASGCSEQKKPRDSSKDHTNSIGMKFVWIPPGSFMMGSPKEEKLRRDDEVQHEVTLTKGFYMAMYTVTQEEWESVMGNNPSYFVGEKNLPVERLSWDQCQDFITKLREKDKKAYRLPTEAEWEYACRAGTTTAFYFGDDPKMLNDYGWFQDNSSKRTHPVGQKKSNAWGLHDMHGNIWQMCQDWYGAYPQKPVVDPQGPDTWTEGKVGRVLRGGDYSGHIPEACRSAGRHWSEPSGLGIVSFRVCFFAE